MNTMARVVRSTQADVPVETVLNLSAFDLDQILERRPTFLEPEYPFEWTGVYQLEPGQYAMTLEDGPDPEMSLVAIPGQATDEDALKQSAEQCVRLFAQGAQSLRPGDSIAANQHLSLELDSKGTKSFPFEVKDEKTIGFYAQHTAEEFDLKIIRSGQSVSPIKERVWVAEHEHDDEVGSIAIEREGNVDPEKLNQWIGTLLAEKGVDIFRTKGFISYQNESRRVVFQGVHMLFTAQPGQEWGDEPRCNQLVFIGRNLDEAQMRKDFDQCLI